VGCVNYLGLVGGIQTNQVEDDFLQDDDLTTFAMHASIMNQTTIAAPALKAAPKST